jgi:hypothetical protein
MLIDCDTCRMRDIACGDCVISLLLGAPHDCSDLAADEAAALGALAAGGLAPPLRLVPVSRSQPPDVRWQPTRPSAAVDLPAMTRSRRSLESMHGTAPPARRGP